MPFPRRQHQQLPRPGAEPNRPTHRRPRLGWLSLTALLGALVVAACGGDGNTGVLPDGGLDGADDGAACGDGACVAPEDCVSCAADCGACTGCGDGSCVAPEDCSRCATDCGACPACPDGACGDGETCETCAADCGACSSCGNGTCSPPETCNSCASDCGDGTCCTPLAEVPQPPVAVLQASGSCGAVSGCGGALDGRWDVSELCVETDGMLGQVYGVCSTARVSVSGQSASGQLTFSGGTFLREYTYTATATVTLPNNCSFCQCSQKEAQLQSAGIDASCSPQCAGGDCFCTISLSRSVRDEDTYTVSGSTVTTGAGSTFEYCASGGTLELQATGGGVRYQAVHADYPETCNGFDDDLDGVVDDAPVDCPPDCSFVGVCTSGGLAVCSGGRWQCSYPSADHEPVETRCDGLDNDCDGPTDEDIVGADDASRQAGVCAGAKVVCREGQWVDPDWSARAGYEAPEASCDGLDNDCDGSVDTGLAAPAALEQRGVCGGAVQVCAGTQGWQEPDYSSLARHESVEASCDGADNDCDGAVDEGITGTALAANQRGVCAGARVVCAAGAWVEPDYGALAGHEASEVSCDGLDNDCDGAVDSGLTAPLASRQAGVCAGARQVCSGAGGWAEPDYGAIAGYLADEQADCDGLDNDCDGSVDDGYDRDGDGHFDGQVAACVAAHAGSGRVDCDDGSALFTRACVIHVNGAVTGGARNGTSWADAFADLRLAVAAAKVGYQVWIAQGTYRPGVPGDPSSLNNRYRLTSGVSLYGGFAGTETTLAARDPATRLTILSGDRDSDDGPGFTNRGDNTYTLVDANQATGIVLDGLVLEGASALINGGALSLNGAQATVRGCTFRDNAASSNGAGIFVFGNGAVTVTDSRFEGNRATYGAGIHVSSGAATVSGCTFTRNTVSYEGAGLHADGGTVTVQTSRFEQNQGRTGGAISSSGFATLGVTGCTFVGNTAETGGAVLAQATTTVTDCTFTGNSATQAGGALALVGTLLRGTFEGNTAPRGGAVLAYGAATAINARFHGNTATSGGALAVNFNGTPLIAGCVFDGNSATGNGGAIEVGTASTGPVTAPVIVNCTFASNTAGGAGGPINTGSNSSVTLTNLVLWANTPATPGGTGPVYTMSYTAIDSNASGTNLRLTVDPFVDANGADGVVGNADDDLHLDATRGAACIDSGSSAAVPAALTTDAAGAPRVVGSAVDRGAYEGP